MEACFLLLEWAPFGNGGSSVQLRVLSLCGVLIHLKMLSADFLLQLKVTCKIEQFICLLHMFVENYIFLVKLILIPITLGRMNFKYYQRTFSDIFFVFFFPRKIGLNFM